MAIMKYEEARNKYCPEFSTGESGVKCMLGKCMAWQDDIEYVDGIPNFTGRGECSKFSPFRLMKVLPGE